LYYQGVEIDVWRVLGVGMKDSTIKKRNYHKRKRERDEGRLE